MNESMYARQLNGGFSALRFDEPLESEFRVRYATSNLGFVRIGSTLGLTLVALSSLLDWRLLPSEFASAAILVKLGVVIPLFLLLLLSTYPGSLARYTNLLASCSAVALSAGTAILLMLGPRLGVASESLGVYVAGLFVYLMLGLRLFPALACSLPLAAVFVWFQSESGVGAVPAAYNSFFLVFANVVGAFACYRLEYSARTIFLEQEIVSILGGCDTVTGIPNRRLFNTHLQSVRRQGDRDGKSIAVVLVEIDHFEAFDKHYGHRAGESALRRVAHTVMRSARRPLDYAARFGNAEFGLVLYDPDQNHLHSILKQVRDRIVMLNISNLASPASSYLTVSIGAALSLAGTAHDVEGLLELADLALRQAKADGSDGMEVLTMRPNSGELVTRGPWQAAAEE